METNIYFVQKDSENSPVEEYVLYDTDYNENTITLQKIGTEVMLTGTVTFADEILLTTRSYDNYVILAILPEYN